ncbi:MAG: nickel-dependent lactate racemase [Pyrinomonadaceae bacterium]|nr:nickel-dependent lactate racemase [Pyrinomonadaceae bacterium]
MPVIDLKYGRKSIAFEYDDDRCDILGQHQDVEALSDIEIGQRLDAPIGTKPLEEIFGPGESILIVVPDATRQTAAGQIVNLVVRRLIANGSLPSDITIIFATGIHRKVNEAEKSEILTPFIAQRIKTQDHDPRDLAKLVRLGETAGGISVELNRALVDFDHTILVGGISFHYFAGFTGGRKLICPGLASSSTISATHRLAFDCEKKSRREGVDSGLLDGNAVHEAFMEAVSKIRPPFAISTIVNSAGDAVDLFCGDWIASHRAACDVFAKRHTVNIAEKRDLVIVSCGGSPHDINLIQAHKALEAASNACNEGGAIVLLAECAGGLGRDDFLKWFAASDSGMLAESLCKKYQVNGQTAWSLLKKAERFDIRVVTSLDDSSLATMRMTAETSFAGLGKERGFIIPEGARTLVRAKQV